MKLSYSKIKKVFLFSQKSPPHFSTQARKNKKKSTSKKYPYISGNGNPKKASYILGNGTFQPKPQKMKKIHSEKRFLIFQEMELSNSKIKKFLIFFKKKAFLIFSQKILLSVFILPTFLSDCFLSGTYCTTSATDLRKRFLLSGVFYLTLFPHICHSTAIASDLREIFYSQIAFFTLHSFPDIWYHLHLSRLPW